MARPVTETLRIPAPPLSTGGRKTDAEKQLPGRPASQKASFRLLELYREHGAGLAAWLRARFGDGPPEPEDVTQLAFQKLAERDDLDDIENLKAYLWRTAHNLLLKEIRSLGIRKRGDFEIERLYFSQERGDLGPERVLQAEQQLKIINLGLLAMPEKRRRAFMLHRLDGLTVSAVARELRLSRTAAAKHIARASSDLDALLAQHPESLADE
ncbi:MAG: sigma-70 family RNA polymerase sigma factor [Pseudomonadota bacterium]